MKLLVPIIFAVVCTSCTSLPHRTIFVTDQKGRPLPGVAVGPYPISLLPFGPGSKSNQTDVNGRIEIYDVIPGCPYSLWAEGFRTREIPFPALDNTSYALKHRR